MVPQEQQYQVMKDSTKSERNNFTNKLFLPLCGDVRCLYVVKFCGVLLHVFEIDLMIVLMNVLTKHLSNENHAFKI
jgi:hypothetical protein